MDLRYSEADEKFRRELRAWLAAEVPKHPSRRRAHDWPARRVYDTGWQRKLFEAGYAGINWPKEYGGRDATLTEQLVYYEETARAHAPYVGVNFVGLLHGGPTVIAEGTPEQKETHLPRILRGEEVWCQGFSEPAAGSDLAALKTTRRARRRPLRRERPQDLDLVRAGRRLLRAARAHRSRARRSTAASAGSSCR